MYPEEIIIGIFSYNEGNNLKRIVQHILSEEPRLSNQILLLDDSDDPYSLQVLKELTEKYGIRKISNKERKGKIFSYNTLLKYFLESNADVLVHFDADLILESGVIKKLYNNIASGIFDVTGCMNRSLLGRTLFERSVRLLSVMGERARMDGTMDLPLVGHNGAYSRRAANIIYPVPTGGINEELYVVSIMLSNGLKAGLTRDALSYFRVPSNMNDYIMSHRRLAAQTKKFMSINESRSGGKILEKALEKTRIRMSMRHVYASVSKDIAGLILSPYILAIRKAAIWSSGISNEDEWEIVSSTKNLD
ncbi:hypothetical protein IX51_03805 [uncultured archaeon]|nr:hypothetical protein IX51_03805 [uncultured archaeon]